MPVKKSKRDAQLRNLGKHEIALMHQVEKGAAMRRALPPGPLVTADYVFKERPRPVRLSQLFGRGRTELLIYHFMYAPDDEKPCRMCNMWADGYNAVAKHVGDRANLVLVAKAPAQKFRKWGKARGWDNIRLLSSSG